MTPKDIYNQERITDLLVRYWGLGRPLDELEKDILLIALDNENKSLNGPLHVQALQRLAAKGIA